MAQRVFGDGVQTYLKVSVRRQGESVVVEVGGELDLASSTRLEQALRLAWQDEPDAVVLDLAKLKFLDMSGLRVLLEGHRQAEERGRKLVLTHVPQPIRRVLGLARVTELFTIQA